MSKKFISKKIFIGTSIFLVIFLFAGIKVNRLINSSLSSATVTGAARYARPVAKAIESSNQSAKAVVKHSLSADDPSQYGIIVYKGGDMPCNQFQWDINMSKLLTQPSIIKEMDARKVFSSAQMSSREFKRRIQQIDARIKEYEGIRRKNPDDEDTERKLNTLYMLKSTLTLLEGKISNSKPPQ